MDKSFKKKLIKQIGRLCEKQYRKGFQQGFYACKDNILTPKKVDDFRFEGSIEDYKKVKSPVSGQIWNSLDRLDGEIAMKDMQELQLFFYLD